MGAKPVAARGWQRCAGSRALWLHDYFIIIITPKKSGQECLHSVPLSPGSRHRWAGNSSTRREVSFSALHQPFRICITGLIRYFSFLCRHEPFARCAPKTFSFIIAFPVELPPPRCLWLPLGAEEGAAGWVAGHQALFMMQGCRGWGRGVRGCTFSSGSSDKELFWWIYCPFHFCLSFLCPGEPHETLM